MIEQVTFGDFCDRFHTMDRHEQFSYAGKRALFEWLEELEDDTGQPIELDVIALCCEFTEYENLEELQQNYTDISSMDELMDHTIVIPIEDSDGFIIQDF